MNLSKMCAISAEGSAHVDNRNILPPHNPFAGVIDPFVFSPAFHEPVKMHAFICADLPSMHYTTNRIGPPHIQLQTLIPIVKPHANHIRAPGATSRSAPRARGARADSCLLPAWAVFLMRSPHLSNWLEFAGSEFRFHRGCRPPARRVRTSSSSPNQAPT